MIILKPFTKTDAPIIIDWNFTEEELLQFGGTAFTHPLTEDQVLAFMKVENSLFFKAIDTDNDTVIGVGEIILMENNATKLARIVVGDRNNRGKGYGQKMMQAFVDYCLNDIQSDSVILNVFDWNIGAIKCYEKIGFTFADVTMRSFDLPNGEQWFSKQMDYTKK
ncbi:GNAT family protein [Myroides sp.]|uniref:GNAT family N-acetyltransferase n=1 Tax=Myroides sp. TaxID=1874736 RepID=UPI0028B241D4|nr:GNAT family protein [Myroides sp.]